jgi:flagella basal body P-ring formation protein FlgA
MNSKGLKTLKFIVIFSAVCGAPESLAAAPIEAGAAASIEARIETAARQALRAQANAAGLVNPSIVVEVRTHDLSLRPCARDIDIEVVDTQFVTRMRFAAVCSATPSWRAEYVVRGSVEADVVVTTAAVVAGQELGASQLAVERRDASGTPGAISDLAAAVGMSSRRPLHTGEIIDKSWLLEPMLVKRGATVSIVARDAGIEVQAPGEAMEDGRRDQIVRVRNTLNGKVLRARVIAGDTVEPAEDAP